MTPRTVLVLASVITASLFVGVTARFQRESRRKTVLQPGYVDIRMPGASPKEVDAYLCSAKVMQFDEEVYITKFEPLGTSADTVHHMLIYGCPSGARKSPMWDCGHHGVCPQSKILFAWAKNAPPANLPENVGFRVPVGDTIVLQLHYARALGKEGVKDSSGIRLHYTPVKPKYLGGIYLMVAAFNIDIPPHKANVTADVNCISKSDVPIHVFGFRTHAHQLGTVISGYKYFSKTGTYELFAKGNPQWPQAFYPLDPPYEISPKDIIASRCVYNSTLKDERTGVGMSHTDEMCNLYMMFFTDMDKGDDFFECLDEELKLPPLPEGSLIPPPKNAGLEEVAIGKMGHSGHTLDAMKYVVKGTKEPSSTKAASVESKEESSESEDAVDPASYPVPGVSLKQYYSNPVFDPSMNVADNQETLRNPWAALTDEARVFHTVPNWPSLGDGIKLGQVSAVSMTEGGTLVVFHRADRVWDMTTFDSHARLKHPEYGPIKTNAVLYLSPEDGAVIGGWGKNSFYMPHGLTVDHEDNVWLTDVGLHQVFKYTQDGKKLMELGAPMEPGSDNAHFCKPTSVAIDPKSGHFFVADGYCNSRILKFSPDGSRLLFTVGGQGNAMLNIFSSWNHRPGPFDFNVPHALTLDPGRNLLFVADRENGRIQAFTTGNMSYVGTITSKQFGGRLFSVAYSPAFNGMLFAVNGPSEDGTASGFVVSPRARSKREIIAATFGSNLLEEPHDLHVTADANEVYVAETNPCRLSKFVRGDLGKLQKSLKGSSALANDIEKPQVGALKAKKMDVSPVLPTPPKDVPRSMFSDGKLSNWGMEIMIVAAVPIVVLGLVLILLRMRNRSSLRAVYQTYKHTGPDKYGFGGILGGGRRKAKAKDGFERLDTTGSDGEDDLFVNSNIKPGPRRAMDFSLDDESSSDSDAEVFSQAAAKNLRAAEA